VHERYAARPEVGPAALGMRGRQQRVVGDRPDWAGLGWAGQSLTHLAEGRLDGVGVATGESKLKVERLSLDMGLRLRLRLQ
jgi:hypothetical protein